MRARPSKTAVWPAPIRGLLRAGNFVDAPMDAAEELENFIPTSQGARLRGGAVLHATVGAAVTRLIIYRSGGVEEMFAATDTSVYDVSAPADATVVPTAEFAGQTSGEWSYTQFATPGGQFLMMVNGADSARLYDGTSWSAIVDFNIASGPSIETSALSYVWSHKRRLWFVEKNTLSAFYLSVNSIGGTAVEFPLDGVFRLGGALLFGGTWSIDSGAGLDDVMVFATTEGELAIYQGTDPGSAADWALTGVYRIGRPLEKNSHFRAGGDLMIVTEDGIVSVAEALQKDRASLYTTAITAPIEELWQQAVARRELSSRFPCHLWPSRTLFIVGVPDVSGMKTSFVANTRTGAWGRVTGWDVQTTVVFKDDLYFGDASGNVALADAGGSDLGEPYTGVFVPKFQEFGAADDKIALHARALWRSNVETPVRISCFSNYAVGQIPPVVAPSGEDIGKWGGGAKWGDGTKWGGTNVRIAGSDWQAVSALGFSLAPALVVASDRDTTPKFEISAIHLRYEVGRSI